MKYFTENELLTCWQAVKQRMTKKEVAFLFSITEEEAVDMYSQAHRIYGSKKFRQLEETPAPEAKKAEPVRWERPKGVYDNPSHEDVLNKYLSMDI